MKEEQARKIVIRIESRAGADAMLRVCSRGGGENQNRGRQAGHECRSRPEESHQGCWC